MVDLSISDPLKDSKNISTGLTPIHLQSAFFKNGQRLDPVEILK